jgi:pimeloyl-ACP methyl ester carboxylesterase
LETAIPHRPVVLVHGTRTSSAIWRPQAAALRAHGHPVIAVDLPGHGPRHDERFTREGALTTIDDAVRSCDRPPLLVGLSLGGYASLAYAGRHGDRVAGVMLSGCSTEIKGKPLTLYRRVAARVTRRFGIGGDGWHVVTDMLAALAGYSPLADLRRLTLPVWFVNGRRDPLRLDEWRYRRAAPAARLTVVPGAGHDVNSHRPAAFTGALLDALTELRQKVPSPA